MLIGGVRTPPVMEGFEGLSAAEIAHAVNDSSNDYLDLPWHAAQRLAAALGTAEVMFADHQLSQNDDGTLSGTAIVFTDKLVAQANLDSAPRSANQNVTSSTVHVAVWPRRLLERYSLHAGNHGNQDWEWAQDWGDRLPPSTAVTLHYGGEIGDVVLPVATDPTKAQRAKWKTFIPTLGSDLS